MQSNIGTQCNCASNCSTCLWHSDSSHAWWKTSLQCLRVVSWSRKMYVALFCIQGVFQWMLLYFPIAGVRPHWRKITFCCLVWKMIARMLIQEKTEGCLVTVKGDGRFKIFLWSMRLSGKKSKPTNNKLLIWRAQTLPFAWGDWLSKIFQSPAPEGCLKNRENCWM